MTTCVKNLYYDILNKYFEYLINLEKHSSGYVFYSFQKLGGIDFNEARTTFPETPYHFPNKEFCS